MKYYLFFISLIFSFNSAYALDIQLLDAAGNWTEARSKCQDLGESWDLPKISEIKEFYDLFSSFNSYPQKNIESQELGLNHLIWARSDEEYLNQQFVKLSQVLKIDDETLTVDGFAHSRLRTNQLRNYRNNLLENIDRISRTQAEQAFLLGFLEIYNTTESAKKYIIDINAPLDRQGDELAYYIAQTVPSEILMVLMKPSRLYVEVEIENTSYELEILSNGIEVVCVQRTPQLEKE